MTSFSDGTVAEHKHAEKPMVQGQHQPQNECKKAVACFISMLPVVEKYAKKGDTILLEFATIYVFYSVPCDI